MNAQKKVVFLALPAALYSLPGFADESGAGLAKQLSNPVANLISVPFQLNVDDQVGPNNGTRTLLNVQPVIPITLNDETNIISRTILPFSSQSHVTGEGEDQAGMGDVVQSFFYSPKSPTQSGLIWGVGPVLLLPTGTDSALSGKKWGAGPTAVLLKQSGPWTYGGLANHIWDYAGEQSRKSVNATFLQPFVSYTTPDAISYSFNSESTYDWTQDQWSVPVNFNITKVTKIGSQIIQFGGGFRYWVHTPEETGPEGLGIRLNLTFLFPQ
ncbi:transporter [Buttiauxella sp. B2]|uniref:transporter n=1 Tax=Buttiauxella sp. B2 TaxID=2587812 RepID=UPI00111D1585|nr:transporter [Buttiauxella sp. B2]TNV11867.1 transporter [Buttiauxella sp. B2]